MRPRATSCRCRVVVAAGVLAAGIVSNAACGLFVDQQTFSLATLDGANSPARDGGIDAGRRDASIYDGGVHDASLRDGREAMSVSDAVGEHDVTPACEPTAGDAMPEGGHAPDPGTLVCNTHLPSADGGRCDTAAGEFCCVGARSADSGVTPTTICKPTDDGQLTNLVGCLAKDAPIDCDETGDCPAGEICCFAPNPSAPNAIDGQFVRLCAPPSSDGGCDLVAAYGTTAIGAPQIRVCKRNGDCGPCGTCHVFCCNSVDETELCGSPSSLVCTEGQCLASAYDDFQNDSETDIDCGGRYRTDASLNDASDRAPACASGFKCRIGRDCASGLCGPADDAGLRYCQ